MATLGQLVVKLITDVTEFSKGMDTAAKKMTEVGQKMTDIGRGMTMGVTLPLVAAGTAAVKFASDLEETRNKTRVVFGSMADSVMRFGKSASDSLGMSENAALSFASTYGSILSNMGLAEDQVSDMSMALTQLTADYASFHNLKPEEAFEKIKAGLVGSSEPLIGLGKDLRQASVQAYALKAGIAAAGEAMTPTQLAMARFGLLMEQSKKETGDFARTSDGLANSMRILQGQLEDTLASFGEILIPVVVDFLQALIPVLRWFNELPQPVKNGIVYLLAFAAAVGPILTVLGTLLTIGGKVAAFFGAGGALSGALSGLTGAIGSAWAAISGFVASIGAAALPVIALVAAIGALIAVLVAFGPQAWNTIKLIFEIGLALQHLAARELGRFLNRLIGWVRQVAEGIGRFAQTFYAAGRNLMVGLVNGAASVAWKLVEIVLKPIYYIIAEVKRVLGIRSPSRVFAEYGRQMMEGLAKGVESYGMVPVQATVESVRGVESGFGRELSGGGAFVRGGKGMTVEIGQITIQGDLSESQKKALKREMVVFFTKELAAAA